MASVSGNFSPVEFLKTPESLKAPIWHHFGFRKDKEKDELDKSKAICKLCQMEVKYCGNTTNLRNHLLRHHPDLASKPSGPQQMKLKETLQLPANSARSLKITEAIAGFNCKDMRPYSVVENEGFRHLMKVTEPHYVMVSRKRLSEEVIPNMYQSVKENVKNIPYRQTHKNMSRLDVTETFHGISLPGHLHTQDSLNYASHFPFQDSDILIVSYPKSGTTWMQEMVTLILSRGDPTPSQTVPNWARAPWLEQYYCPQVLSAAQEPRVLTTHLPYHTLASALKASNTKVIYIGRNPRDVAVSYYHFHHMAKFLPEPGSFDEFLSKFLEGQVHYGSWFDHVKGWTDPEKDIENFFFITYEEMCKDPRGSLQRVSTFLQCPLVEEEITRAQEQCSFSTMKDNAMVNYTLVAQDIMDHSCGKFMRKGKSEDWKNMFNDCQRSDFDAVFEVQMQNSHLKLMWTCTDIEMTATCPVLKDCLHAG